MENDETNDTSENLLHPANSGEIIHTDRQHYNSLHSSDSSEEQIDQDKVVVKLEDFKAELTNVVNILPPDCYKLREKDKFDIIKFTVKVKAVYIYQWEVYRKPNEIKKHFAEVLKELSKNYMTPTGEKLDIFNIFEQLYKNEINPDKEKTNQPDIIEMSDSCIFKLNSFNNKLYCESGYANN